jgi:hypothetical protein
MQVAAFTAAVTCVHERGKYSFDTWQRMHASGQRNAAALHWKEIA